MSWSAVCSLAAAGVPLLALGPWAARAGEIAPRAQSVRQRCLTADRPALARGRTVSPVVVASIVAGPPVVAAVAGWPVPVVVLGLALALWGRLRLVARREVLAVRAVDRAAPDVVDLLAVAAGAGHPPHRCLRLVAERAPPTVAHPLQATCRRLDRGVPLVDAVVELRRGLGVLGDPVADALIDAFRTGAPLAPALDRVAATARDGRRRAAEAEARRLPVLLLLPLVCCVLPAFGLLAVVPLVAASVRSLG
ncbi:MAG: type II secretion system F family protein [Actinobacteria bacterium]|nr:type II secretion system F family protein [Actinomycetota bacterium]